MTIEEMKRLKKERGLTNEMVAQMARLPRSTVQKVFSGETKHPRFETLHALECVFHSLDVRVLQETASLPWYDSGKEDRAGTVYSFRPTKAQVVAEPTFSYGTSALQNPGPFTVEDWKMLPDGERAELIDGQLIYMESPTVTHQLIAGEVYRQIANYIYDHDGSCVPAIAPLGVQLDCDDRTMVEPDAMVVCDPEKTEGRYVYGAPDFVLEVLSPSTAKKDIFTKTAKYHFAGVREYWIIDPQNCELRVMPFGFDEDIATYDMTEPVPLRIFGGKLLIDFRRICQWIEKNKR